MCDAYYGEVLDYTHIVLKLGNRKNFRLLHRVE
jgi:hypothetical protein